MNINCEKSGMVLCCSIEGRIDTTNYKQLEECFMENYDDIKSIKIDAKNLTYISSAGLRVLLKAVKRLGDDSVSMFNSSEMVKEIFETTGFKELVNIT